jgi:small subunit ribosomal protein S2
MLRDCLCVALMFQGKSIVAEELIKHVGENMKHVATIEQLLESGAHFGHLTRRWNPKMEQFIFNERNGIHIIDLRKTQILLDIARQVALKTAMQGKTVLFVGTKKQMHDTLDAAARECNQNFVIERWLGGMLTNFSTIRKSIKRLNDIEKMEVDGTYEKITKKERLLLGRERDRLRKIFGGIEDMTRLPGALFIVDIKKEHIAVKEAKILGIPVIALVDTNCDPEEVDFPIPGNDDSVKTVEMISKIIGDAIKEGGSIAKVKQAEMRSESDRKAKENESHRESEDAKVHRKMRERKAKAPQQEAPKAEAKPVAKPAEAPKAEAKVEAKLAEAPKAEVKAEAKLAEAKPAEAKPAEAPKAEAKTEEKK